jgi:hypothetical protein
LTVQNNVSAGNSATLNVSSGGNFDIGGNLSVGTGSTITTNGTLDVTGTITGAQPTGSSVQFRSVATGGWNTTSTWEYSTNGTTWSSVTSSPTSSQGTITVRSGHTVTITSNITIDQATIDSGGKLILSGGTLTVANGADAQDLIINGIYERTAVSTNMTATGLVFCGNGGRYIHNVDGGTLPTITWDANSTLQIDQSVSDNEFTETFGHVVINGSSSFSMYNSSTSTIMSIAGNLTFNSSGTVYISGPSCTNSQTLNLTGSFFHTGGGSFIVRKYQSITTFSVSGNFTLSNGIFTLGAPSGTNSYNGTLNITGNLTISAGQFNIHKSNGSSTSINNTVNVIGNFEMSGGGLLFSDETGASISSNSVYALLNVKGNFTHTAGTISETASDLDVITRISLNGTSGTQTLESTGQTGTIAFNAAGSDAQCVVSATKTFVQSASTSFVIGAGASTPDYVINGTHRRTGTTFTTTGTMSVSSGGTYEHNCNGQSIPTASWNAASNCNVTGITSTALTGGTNQSFGNFTWNCTTQSVAQTLASGFGCQGNYTQTTSNAQTLTTGGNANIGGNMTITAGTFAVGTNFTLGVTGTTSVTSTLTLAGTGAKTFTGNVTINSGGAINQIGAAIINFGGNLSNNGTFSCGTSTAEFNSSTNATLSGSSSTAFYNVTVNKGTSVSNVLEVTGPMSMTGDLTMTNGLFKVTHASATIKQPVNVSSIAIPSTAGIHINGGTMSGINATVNNRGLFKVTTGTASIGTSAGNSLSLATGSSYIMDGSGTLNVTGRIEATGGSYTQSSGMVNVCTLSNGNTASGTGNANFDISATSTVNITGGSILIKYPNSNATPYSSLRITSGAGSKTISGGTILIGDGSSSSNFLIYSDVALNNLTLNASGNATLQSAITSNGTVAFTNGKFVLSNYNFTVGSSGLISGESSSTYFVTSGTGVLTQQGINSSSVAGKKLFPIGLSTTSYTPMVLANTGTSDDFSARVTSGVLSGGETGTSLTTKYVDRTWLISEGTSGGSAATVNLYWNAAEEQGQFTRTACFVTHYTGGGWDLSTATSASGTPYTTFRSGITSFSPFTVTSTSALPIELTSFQANCSDNNTVDITWSTATEHNTNYFRVDKSRDGMQWDVLNTIGAAGNSNYTIDYALTDAFPNPGINYYRLTQYDNDGVFETFDAQAAVCKDQQSGTALSSYPNPSSGDFNVDLQTEELEGDATLLITDAKGAVVHSQDIKIIKGNNNYVIHHSTGSGKGFEPGIYYISVRTATSTVTTKHSMR